MPIGARFDKKIKSLPEQDASAVKTGKIKRRRPYELLKDLLGRGGSGRGDLSSNDEEILRKRFKKIRP